jgi:uncharacterized protein
MVPPAVTPEAPRDGSGQLAGLSLLGEGVTNLPIFWVGDTGSPTFAGSRCPSCGDLRFPPQPLCPIDNEAADRVPLGRGGRIYEVVEVAIGPAGFPTPYWAGYVDLDEGVRVFGQIEISGSRRPAHGDKVELEFEEVSHPGSARGSVLAPQFRLRP